MVLARHCGGTSLTLTRNGTPFVSQTAYTTAIPLKLHANHGTDHATMYWAFPMFVFLDGIAYPPPKHEAEIDALRATYDCTTQ